MKEMEEEKKIIAVSHQYSGPLPQPSDMAKYEEVVPGAAERILKMAEKEQDKRHEKEEKEMRLKAKLALRGQSIGFVLTLLFSAISILFAYMGHLKLAAMFGTPLIIGVCTIFVLRRTSKDNQ